MPSPKTPATKPAAKPAARVPTVTTLTVNEIDAVLRDPACPADVRATIAAHHTANEYLRGVKFNVDKDNGYTTVTRDDA